MATASRTSNPNKQAPPALPPSTTTTPTKSIVSTSKRDRWSASNYPYETDYNDHFETPHQAYIDVQPLIDWLYMNEMAAVVSATATSSSSSTAAAAQDADRMAPDTDNGPSTSSDVPVVLYDPYYCNGRTKVLLHQLGYTHVVHDKRDFYADVSEQMVPSHDILITNPPYSDTHKQRCLDFCLGQLRGDGTKTTLRSTQTPHRRRSFLLLMPAYTAAKQYYRDSLQSTPRCHTNTGRNTEEDVVYLIPSSSYHYDHPDQSGKAQSPFDSLWFCGIGSNRVSALEQYWNSLPNVATRPALVTSLAELAARQVISLHNRPNPRQRGQKRKLFQQTNAGLGETKEDDPTNKRKNPTRPKANHMAPTIQKETTLQRIEKKSKYRDSSSGKRTKKRF